MGVAVKRKMMGLARRWPWLWSHVLKLAKKRDDRLTDVYVVSYPKCGRTWLRLMMGKAIQAEFELDTDDLLRLHGMSEINRDIPVIRFTHDDLPHRKPISQIETSKEKFSGKKVVLLVRDPRDVVVSSYFQATKRQGIYEGDIDSYIRGDIGGVNSIVLFYNVWAKERVKPEDFMVVSYEDLRSNTFDSLKKVLCFVGLGQINDANIEEAIKFAEFNNMRAMEKKNALESDKLSPGKVDDADSYKTRKGKVGGYIESVTEDQIRYINDSINSKLDPMFSRYIGGR